MRARIYTTHEERPRDTTYLVGMGDKDPKRIRGEEAHGEEEVTP